MFRPTHLDVCCVQVAVPEGENQTIRTAPRDFKALMLSESVLEGLAEAGYVKPSPVQARAIPLGKFGADLIVQAKSGTGKTCMFSVIVLEALQLSHAAEQALVVSPTRELAHQTRDVIRSIGARLPKLGCEAFVGGIATEEDVALLSSTSKPCHVVVGTPGRLRALIELGTCSRLAPSCSLQLSRYG